MEFDEVVSIMKKYLPEYLVQNSSFKNLIVTFRNLAKDGNLKVEIADNIFNSEVSLQKSENVNMSGSYDRIVLFNSGIGHNLSLYCGKNYEMILTKFKSLDDDNYETIEIVVSIKEELTTWKVTTRVENDYVCKSYNTDFYAYNIDGDEIPVENIEHRKDMDFVFEFGVPLDDARECRLNFDENIDYINRCKNILMLEMLDEERSDDRNTFTIPFNMSEFTTFVTGYEESECDEEENTDDYVEEEYENEEELSLEERYSRIKLLEEEISAYTGVDGSFIMSRNMFEALGDYFEDQFGILRTTGFIIRKSSNRYTVYYTKLTEEQIIILPKECSKEEVVDIYLSEPLNANVDGLSEFFETTKNYRLDNN